MHNLIHVLEKAVLYSLIYRESLKRGIEAQYSSTIPFDVVLISMLLSFDITIYTCSTIILDNFFKRLYNCMHV